MHTSFPSELGVLFHFDFFQLSVSGNTHAYLAGGFPTIPPTMKLFKVCFDKKLGTRPVGFHRMWSDEASSCRYGDCHSDCGHVGMIAVQGITITRAMVKNSTYMECLGEKGSLLICARRSGCCGLVARDPHVQRRARRERRKDYLTSCAQVACNRPQSTQLRLYACTLSSTRIRNPQHQSLAKPLLPFKASPLQIAISFPEDGIRQRS